MNIFAKFKHMFDKTDLTKGPIFSQLMIFMIPIILSMVFQQLYTLTDSIVVGQNLGPNEIAAINDVGPLSSLALQFTLGVTSGCSVIVANKIGENKFHIARRSFLTQIIIFSVMTVIMTLAFCLCTDYLLELMKITQIPLMPTAMKSIRLPMTIFLLSILALSVRWDTTLSFPFSEPWEIVLLLSFSWFSEQYSISFLMLSSLSLLIGEYPEVPGPPIFLCY